MIRRWRRNGWGRARGKGKELAGGWLDGEGHTGEEQKEEQTGPRPRAERGDAVNGRGGYISRVDSVGRLREEAEFVSLLVGFG